MRLLTVIQFLFLIAILTLHAPAQSQMSDYRALFKEGKCDLLDTPLKVYRSKLRKLGRINLQVDYMLSMCRCKSPGFEALRQLPSVYRHLTYKDLLLIRDSMFECRTGDPNLASIPMGGAIVMGKGGRRIVSQLSDDSIDLYSKRIFDQDKVDQAESSLKKRGFRNIVKRRNFILTGDADILDLENLGDLMEDVLKSFVTTFGFELPRILTTVYVYKDKWALLNHAESEHGVNISSGIFAYTFPQDASITIRMSGGFGTVGHEVFHVLLNYNTPYTPPWLNEGAAALFEEFRFTQDGQIEGAYRPDHWRIGYLRKAKLISLDKLLDMVWDQFDHNSEIQNNHAISKFFIMYLQEKQKLQELLKAYESKDIFDDETDINILRGLFQGKQLSEIDSDFKMWLSDKIPDFKM